MWAYARILNTVQYCSSRPLELSEGAMLVVHPNLYRGAIGSLFRSFYAGVITPASKVATLHKYKSSAIFSNVKTQKNGRDET
eukprot:6207520-Pleurochrysis_carterae.AAC.1